MNLVFLRQVFGLENILEKFSEIKDSEQFKLDDAGSYDSCVDDYHNCVNKLSKPFVKQMVTLSCLKPGQRILDVGTGSGIVANYASKLMGNSGSGVGIDLSEGMLKTAATNAKKIDLNNAHFLRVDAENLSFLSESFDSVLSMYAIDHFPDAERALNEIHRVLKPGGHFVVSTGCRIPPWGGERIKAFYVGINRKIKEQFQANLYAPNFILSLMDKHLGNLPLPPHSNWGEKNSGKELARIVKKTGFYINNMLWNHNMIQIESIEEFWRFQTAIVTEVRKRLQHAGSGLRNSFFEEFKNLAKMALSNGGKLYYCGAVFMISGIRK